MAQHYAIFSALYLPHLGGVENFTAHLAAELVKNGNAVTVVTSQLSPDAPQKETQKDGVEVWRMPSTNLLNGRLPLVRKNACFKRMMTELGQVDINRVLVNTRFYGLSLEGVRFASREKLPVAVLDHSSGYLGFGDPKVDWLVRAYERTMTAAVKAHDPIFCGVSERSCEWLGKLGIEAQGVIHNAIDAKAFRSQASSRDFRAELGIDKNDLLVAFTGRMVKTKGIFDIVEVAHALSAYNDIHFAMAGDGPDYEELTRIAPEQIHLLGPLVSADVSALLSLSDVFLFPSAYPEGLPTSLLEAAAQGIYIISTNVGGAKDIMPSSSYGTVLDHFDAAACAHELLALKADKRTCSRAGKAVKKRVEQGFSWQASAEALDNLEWV